MRSLLYVPGDRSKMLDGALERGADVVVADLEDAVAPRSKGAARRAVATWLAGLATSGELPVEVWVRVNPGDLLADDVGAVTRPGLSGVCLAKAESADELVHLDQLLSGAELAAGMVSGSVGVLPLLESAQAVLAMGEIAAAPRVARLGVGEVDLSSELGVQLGPDEHELLWVRSQLVMYSAAAGLDAPV
ncbi:MAG: HpcH/HpaI aldolase/citrate lyase family protein, partial [Acidimicrobiales bacterium]